MNSSTMGESGVAGFKNLSSPIPYLFGGLAFMLAVIAVALLILACSYRTQYFSSNNSSSDEEKPSNKVVDKEVNVAEPKIVVIMAGETNPTYLAKPLQSASHTIEQAV